MDLETLIRSEQTGLTRRVARTLGGDREAAEDVCQEAFARAWRSLPRDAGIDHQRAWVRRTAGNLAIDELRRRARRPTVSLEAGSGSIGAIEAPEPDAAREALGRLGPDARLVLLLRFEGGLTHAEIGRLLEIGEEAARKRATRARTAFVAAYRRARADSTPVVLLAARSDPPAPYVRWLENAGARVRRLTGVPSERELALADGLVMTGAVADVHSALYSERPRSLRGAPDLDQDRLDLGVIREALALDLPMIGVCRGHQLLNIASGGSLFQDVQADGAVSGSHDDGQHRVEVHAGTTARGLLGPSTEVHSRHHQAIRRLGRHLRVAATSDDGLIETIERTDRRLALGLQ